MVQITKKHANSACVKITGRIVFIASFLIICWKTGMFVPGTQPGDKLRGSNVVVDALSASKIRGTGKGYLIYGTAWKKDETARLVSAAIHSGFRFIDTACQPKHYNEAAVGDGWVNAAKEMGMSREDFFIQTKFTSSSGQDPNNVPYDKDASVEDQVHQSIMVSLRNLKTTYIDSLVLHSPFRRMEDTMAAWRVLESFVDDGKIRQLGISNCYDFGIFSSLYENSRIKPAVLQNRFYEESNFDVKLREFCAEVGVKYQSFWTLTANRNALRTNEIKEMATSKDLTPQTLMYAFMMTMGHTPLSGTTSSVHMAEDVAIMERIQGGETILTQDEMKLISKILGIPTL